MRIIRHTLYKPHSSPYACFRSYIFPGTWGERDGTVQALAVIFGSRVMVRSPSLSETCPGPAPSPRPLGCWPKRSLASPVSSASSCDSGTRFSPASRWAPGWRPPPPSAPASGTCWSGTPSPARSAVWWWSWSGSRCAGRKPRTRTGRLRRERKMSSNGSFFMWVRVLRCNPLVVFIVLVMNLELFKTLQLPHQPICVLAHSERKLPCTAPADSTNRMNDSDRVWLRLDEPVLGGFLLTFIQSKVLQVSSTCSSSFLLWGGNRA